MTGVARIGDKVQTNHGCTSETTIITTRESSTVFIDDGKRVAIVGDKTSTHSYGGRNCSATHQITFSSGSDSVFIDGAAALRIDDMSSNEKITGGSTTIFAG